MLYVVTAPEDAGLDKELDAKYIAHNFWSVHITTASHIFILKSFGYEFAKAT